MHLKDLRMTNILLAKHIIWKTHTMYQTGTWWTTVLTDNKRWTMKVEFCHAACQFLNRSWYQEETSALWTVGEELILGSNTADAVAHRLTSIKQARSAQ